MSTILLFRIISSALESKRKRMFNGCFGTRVTHEERTVQRRVSACILVCSVLYVSEDKLSLSHCCVDVE